MANKDRKTSDASAERVKKASEVHKRRVSRGSRPAVRANDASVAAEAREEAVSSSEDAAVLAGSETAPSRQHAASAREKASPSAEPVSEAVDAVSSQVGQEADSDAPEGGATEASPGVDAGDLLDDSAGGDDAGSDETLDGQEGDDTDPRPRRPLSPGRLAKRIALVAVALAVSGSVVGASLFAWNRWGRFDDHADIQGVWYAEGTAALVTIDEATIRLSDDVVYAYSIDDHEKTIAYSFSNWEGRGRYQFSGDRKRLVITDGDFEGVGNTVDDFMESFQELYAVATGAASPAPEGEGVISLNRDPDPAALAAKQAAEREAERQRQEEAAQGLEDGDGLYYE